MKSFSEKVYETIRKIPRGKVATYTSVASAIRSPRAMRAVGNALNKNPYAPETPCHRVVRSDGSVGGYASGTAKKQRLLEKEGVEIVDFKINISRFGCDLTNF
ncbi:MAG: MGMT family protein [Patescibacteria group bacterium]